MKVLAFKKPEIKRAAKTRVSEEHLARVKTSMERINKLMSDLKKHKEENSND